MKPVYLEFSGLNSFSSKAEIDFSVLLAGGIFGIFGATGSGKSSILDAIHLALYGKVDRVATFNDCINQNCDSVSVLFDFEVVFAGKRSVFRVKRETKRKSGSAKAYLWEGKDGQWFALAEGVSDVNKKVEEIVGLSFEDFKTCIALPQGDFATLVKSKVGDRVKLMARLFNLEKYGERMCKVVNARHEEAKNAKQMLQAQINENEGADDEKIAWTQAEVERIKQQTALAKAEAERAQAEERVALELQKEKTAYMQAKEQLAKLQLRYEEMQTLQTLLSAYPTAKAVADKHLAWEKTKQALENARKNVETAKAQHAEAIKRAKIAKENKENSDVEQRLLQAKMDFVKVQDSAEDIAREEKCRADLEACRKEYSTYKFDGNIEDILAKKAEIEKQREELGEDEDLLTYLKRNLQGILLVDAYGEMRADLRDLAEKYPQTRTDIAALLEKYTQDNQAEISVTDVAEAQLHFKKAEQQRKQLKQQIEALEKREQAYKEWENKRKEIFSRGLVLGEAHKLALEKVAALRALGTEKELALKVQTLQAEDTRLKRILEETSTIQMQAEAKVNQWTGVAEEYAGAEKQALADLKNALRECSFASVDEAKQVLVRIGNERETRERVTTFFQMCAVCEERMNKADKAKIEAFNEETLIEVQRIKRQAEETWTALNRELGANQGLLARLLAAKEKYEEQLKLLQEKEKQLKLCEELRALVYGNKFLEFVASEYLQGICLSASKTLLSLTNRKYFLKYEDKEFKVGDNLHGGALRTARTLSGGETFLVSLSLALALSNAICEQSARPSEFFFLDEGFGTLDENLVETVMDVLGKLSQSFAVGLISHVEELKRRISCKALVTGATETHGSSVRVECFG